MRQRQTRRRRKIPWRVLCGKVRLGRGVRREEDSSFVCGESFCGDHGVFYVCEKGTGEDSQTCEYS